MAIVRLSRRSSRNSFRIIAHMGSSAYIEDSARPRTVEPGVSQTPAVRAEATVVEPRQKFNMRWILLG
ncbi:hypothetical protein GCM10009838_68300 [Catenulispora subtropica]|uniref:Uncharacterized protein n=1 Tax=Catenulispora subtropica TaxID=450798 RepID=A0ABP5EA62_9ACTN